MDRMNSNRPRKLSLNFALPLPARVTSLLPS
jgi:hypothetical protein